MGEVPVGYSTNPISLVRMFRVVLKNHPHHIAQRAEVDGYFF